MAPALLRTEIEGLPLVHRGKVRETYEVDDRHLLMVATDRLSAFDVVFDQPIPDKGAVLTRLSAWWFEQLADLGRTHFVSADRERLPEMVGSELAQELERRSIALYAEGARRAEAVGLILADTKFEFGFIDGELALIDEVLTPDSSRFWDADRYAPGSSPPSFDKQFVRDFVAASGWNKEPPAPTLPDDVIAGTRDRYVAA